MAISENKNVHGEGEVKSAVTNWISQINAGGEVYDIATHHGITFKDGNDDTTGVTWNGLTDVEIVIPTIQDLIQDPIKFVGTVDEDTTELTGEKGDLVFITKDCTFVGVACEAGDMAICVGENQWKVVSGENQVSIVAKADNDNPNKHTVAIGGATDVLTVEGKTLALALDYDDLNKNHLTVSKTGSDAATVKLGAMTVDTKKINVVEATKAETIGKKDTIQEASQLKDGTVTINGIEKIVTGINWGAFNQGSLVEPVMNDDEREFVVTGGSVIKTAVSNAGDFVSSVTFGKVTFESATKGTEGAFELVSGIQSSTGQAFVTGINGSSTFTVAGCIQPTEGEDAKYVKAIEGNYVTSVSEGSFELTTGASVIATGFTTEASTGDVLSKMTVTPTTTNVLNSATVDNHVLTFGSASVVNDVTVASSYKSLETTGFKYTSAKGNTAAFVNGGFTKSNDVTYTFDTKGETTYEHTSSYYKINTPELGVSYAGYELSNSGMVAKVGASTFVVSLSGGALPTLGDSTVVYEAANNITASVSTELSYVPHDINVVDKMSIDIPTYTLEEVNEGGITVGKEGDLIGKTATIDLSGFVTDVTIKA